MDRRPLTTAEAPVEQAVSSYIAAMPFLWLDIDDEPRPSSMRGSIERNAIALLSNHEHAPLDPASPGWLGHCSQRPRVRSSGLWNQQHVEQVYDPMFLDTLERLIGASGLGNMIEFIVDDLSRTNRNSGGSDADLQSLFDAY
jgi:hypothetical protein